MDFDGRRNLHESTYGLYVCVCAAHTVYVRVVGHCVDVVFVFIFCSFFYISARSAPSFPFVCAAEHFYDAQ